MTSGDARAAGTPEGAPEGSNYSIHTNNCSNPIPARVAARFGGVNRMLSNDQIEGLLIASNCIESGHSDVAGEVLARVLLGMGMIRARRVDARTP